MLIWCAVLSFQPTNIDYPPGFRHFDVAKMKQIAVSGLSLEDLVGMVYLYIQFSHKLYSDKNF